MTPLGGVVLGLVMAIGDIRVGDLDLLPDVLGWLIVVVALNGLRDAGFRRAQVLAAAALVLSLVALVGPDDDLLDTVHHGVLTVALVLLALAVRDRAQAHDEPAHAARFLQIAVLLGTLGTATAILGAIAASLDVAALVSTAALLLVLGLADLCVAIWLVAALAVRRRLPWLQAEDVPVSSGSGG